MKLSFESSLIKDLSLFGLSNLQSRVYICCLSTGESTVRAIIDYCRIHKAEVYRVLQELEEKDIIEKILTHPIRYRAKPLDECLKILTTPLLVHLDELGEAKQYILEKVGSLKNTNSLDINHSEGFELIPAKVSAKKIINMYNRANTEILYISRGFGDVLRFEIAEALYRAVDRGIKAKGLLNINKKNLRNAIKLEKKRNLIRKHSDDIFSFFIIIDKKEVLFGSSTEFSANQHILYTRDRKNVKYFLDNFNFYFKNAIPLEKRIRELIDERGIFSI